MSVTNTAETSQPSPLPMISDSADVDDTLVVQPSSVCEYPADLEKLYPIFIDMFAAKWARGPHNLARFPSWNPCITPGIERSSQILCKT